MAKPDIIVIDGHAYRWQEICELRRQQLEAQQAAQPKQLALFELKDDCSPVGERSAAGRYQEPTLFMRGCCGGRTMLPGAEEAIDRALPIPVVSGLGKKS
jgi:hypothetical protein